MVAGSGYFQFGELNLSFLFVRFYDEQRIRAPTLFRVPFPIPTTGMNIALSISIPRTLLINKLVTINPLQNIKQRGVEPHGQYY